MRLAGRTALVNRIDGWHRVGVAQAFAAEGAHVVVTGRNAQRGGEVSSEFLAEGGKADFVRSDLAGGLSAVQALAEKQHPAVGGYLDILVKQRRSAH